ncbi:protein TIC 20-IV chloroplastic-like [Trifolium pratense]|uniref:Protein TIC 20 n=1 Tax=Trifolium pratense TaxID=57577 RepID=A0A2K3NSE3_TRIPR|nr:protein TIC 20-IV chloroplastic-like [Trifolium pratense]
MAGQLAAAATTLTNPSLLRLPPLRNKDLIPERRGTFYRKKNFTIKALAGSSLGKSSPRLTAVSSPLSTENRGHLSLSVPKSRRSSSSTRPQAYIYHWSGFRIPANAEKPEWWWRTLSCIPYLIALQMSATGFHLMTGMLLEIALQIVWVASNFMPLIHFKGTLGMYYWAAVALTYIVITMHSIRCALLGGVIKLWKRMGGYLVYRVMHLCLVALVFVVSSIAEY